MTIARKNAVLGQTINVANSAVGDTLFIPSTGTVNVSGTIAANMVYVNGVMVSVSGHSHVINDISSLPTILDKKLDDDDPIVGGFF